MQSTNVADRKQAVLPSEAQTEGLKRGRWKINIHTGVALSCQSSLEVICLSSKCHTEKRGGKLYLGKRKCLLQTPSENSLNQAMDEDQHIFFSPQLTVSKLCTPDLKLK